MNKIQQSDEFCKGQFEYHCIEENEKCRIIFKYLVANGRFSIFANLQILFEGAMKSFTKTYAGNFNDLMDQIVFPTFEARFPQKRSMKKESVSNTIPIDHIKGKPCIKLQPIPAVTLRVFADLLKKLYLKFNVINHEFDLLQSNSYYGWDRYYGTLMTNVHYDVEAQNVKSTFKTKQIQKDLTDLMNRLIPSTHLPLTDVIGLFGYKNKLEFDSPEGELLNDCANDQDIYNASRLNIADIYQINTLKKIWSHDDKSRICDLRVYMNEWHKSLGIAGGPRNPCDATRNAKSIKMNGCCNLFNDLFNEINMMKIMFMLKYSLDFSKPWISQYYHRGGKRENANQKIGKTTRDLDKIWMADIGQNSFGAQSHNDGNDNSLIFG